MPNQRDIRILCKPIVQRRNDLICVNRYLLIVPLGSFFAGLCFLPSSLREYLLPTPIVVALCSLRPDFPFAGARQFMRSGYRTWREAYGENSIASQGRLDEIKPEHWLTSDPDYPDALRTAIETEMLPEIAKSVSWDGALKFETQGSRGPADFAQIALPYVLALGNFERAKEILDVGPLQQLILRHFNGAISGLGDRLAEQGDGLSMEDKRALISVLHEREAAAIQAMTLEKHWQPTPFPAEEKGLV